MDFSQQNHQTEFRLFNIQGKLVDIQEIQPYENREIDYHTLNKGIYQYAIMSEYGKEYGKLLLID